MGLPAPRGLAISGRVSGGPAPLGLPGPPLEHLRLEHLRLGRLRLKHLRLKHLQLKHLRLGHLRLGHLQLGPTGSSCGQRAWW